MNTEREELEDAIARAAYNYNPDRGRDGNDVPFEQGDTSYEVSEARVIAEALIAAGYRKPRTITTLDELDALPDGSVVLDLDETPYQRLHTTGWTALDGDCVLTVGDYLEFPATVLYVPNEEKK